MPVRTCTIALSLAFVSTACVAQSVSVRGIALNSETNELSGWLSAKGEWAVFPSRRKAHYNPYTKTESEKCVSLVNKTELPRSDFVRLNNRYVTVTGYAVDYDNLSGGDSLSDALLSKKYFGNDPVENYCLRQLVFVATGVREQKP